MEEEPSSIVIGRATILGQPAIQGSAPAEVRVRPGQKIRLVLHYEFEEGSRAREEWAFRLESRLGDQRALPADLRLMDRPGRADDAMGHISQEYRVAEAGELELVVTAYVDHLSGDWKGGDTSNRHAKLEQVVRVVVD